MVCRDGTMGPIVSIRMVVVLRISSWCLSEKAVVEFKLLKFGQGHVLGR